MRAGRNMQLIQSLTMSLGESKGIEIAWGDIPTYKDVMENGVGHYLNQVPAGTETPGIRALPGFWRYLSKSRYR